MTNDQQDRRTKSYLTMRSLLDYGMGAIYIMVGLGFIFARQAGLEFLTFTNDWMGKLLGAIFIIYGGWRIYRGYRKNY
jgi:cation transport ATPase